MVVWWGWWWWWLGLQPCLISTCTSCVGVDGCGYRYVLGILLAVVARRMHMIDHTTTAFYTRPRPLLWQGRCGEGSVGSVGEGEGVRRDVWGGRRCKEGGVGREVWRGKCGECGGGRCKEGGVGREVWRGKCRECGGGRCREGEGVRREVGVGKRKVVD